MVRYDLAFIICCCKACLGSKHDAEGEDFYALLGVEEDATQDEIKRGYKRQSLQMHPDKLAQKGKTVTDYDQARFTRMKEAYEVCTSFFQMSRIYIHIYIYIYHINFIFILDNMIVTIFFSIMVLIHGKLCPTNIV